MARQPYKGKHYNIGLGVMPPQLSTLIGGCAEAWTYVDLQLALTMGSLLGVENKASVAVFTSLRNTRTQRDALHAAATEALDTSLQRIFKALMRIHSRLDSARNDIVHGVWGISSEVANAALWVSLHDHAAALIADYHHLRLDFSSPGFNRSQNMLEDCFVWKFSDIADVIQDIRTLSQALGQFHSHLRYRGHLPGDNALKDLNAVPLVQQELALMPS